MPVIQSYNSKNTPSGKLYAVKIAEAVLLYVFTMVFPASLLSKIGRYKSTKSKIFLYLEWASGNKVILKFQLSSSKRLGMQVFP